EVEPRSNPTTRGRVSPLHRSGHRSLVCANHHINLGPHAEILEIDPRLDGKSRSGEQAAVVVRLVVVHVHAVAMDVLSDTMAGAVQRLTRGARALKYGGSRAAARPAARPGARGTGPREERCGRVPGGADRCKRTRVPGRYARAGVAHPRNIGIDRAGPIELAP